MLLQEKLASYEVNDPFVHHLVSKIQSTLEDIKVSSHHSHFHECGMVCCVEWFSDDPLPASGPGDGGGHGQVSRGTHSQSKFQSGTLFT